MNPKKKIREQREEDDKLPVAKRSGRRKQNGEGVEEGERGEVDKFWWSSAELPLPSFSLSFYPVGGKGWRNFPPRRNRPRFTPSEGGGDEARVHLGNVFSNRHLDRATKLVTRTPFIVGRGRISAGETFPRRNFAVHLHAVPESLHFISVQVYK